MASGTAGATDKVQRGAEPLTMKLTITPLTTVPLLFFTAAVAILFDTSRAKVAGDPVTPMLCHGPAVLVITTEPDTLPMEAVTVSETSVVDLFEPAV